MKIAEAIKRLKLTGRNDQCPCGSGKKYKKCHMPADEEAQSKEIAAIAKKAEKEFKEKEDTNEKAENPKGGNREKSDSRKGSGQSGKGNSKQKLPRRSQV